MLRKKGRICGKFVIGVLHELGRWMEFHLSMDPNASRTPPPKHHRTFMMLINYLSLGFLQFFFQFLVSSQLGKLLSRYSAAASEPNPTLGQKRRKRFIDPSSHRSINTCLMWNYHLWPGSVWRTLEEDFISHPTDIRIVTKLLRKINRKISFQRVDLHDSSTAPKWEPQSNIWMFYCN